MNARILITLLIGNVLALGLCCVVLGKYFDGTCPTDDSIITWFNSNRKTLEELVSMIEADDESVGYVGHGIVQARPGASILEARKQEYLRKLSQTGADSFAYTRNEGAIVGLWTDALSISVPSRSKDIEYIPDITKWRYRERLRPTLDGLESNGKEGFWLRHLEGNWYIRYMNG
jgi:hypothetical protein